MGTLLINGTINNNQESFIADILIENGVIKEIGNDLSNSNHEIIDVKGKLILPGGVDVHTHMDLDLGKYNVADDFYTGTVAAAFGGTTTIVDHIAFGPKGCSLQHQINKYHELSDKKSVVDYSFHGVFQYVSDAILNEMKDLVEDGIMSYKIYMTYDNKLNDEEILKVLIKAKELNAVITVHAENDGAIKYLSKYYAESGKTDPIYHALSRPDSSEAEAINRMIYLSEMAAYPKLYFVHVSTKKGLDEIISARKRGVKNIYCETCTQYLTLTEENYKKENKGGLKYIMAPPLRKAEDVEALWKAIENNDVDVVATDHCPFFLKEKLNGKNDFRLTPGGTPGVEERIEIILTEGIKRGISINNLIDKLATKPAKIFGLYPKKGTIQVGMDADLIIVNNKKETIKIENRHNANDYSAYEGFEISYVVETTIQRGNVLVDNEKLLANKGDGIFLRRNANT